MRTLLILLALICHSITATAQEHGIGYPTVAAALEALKARGDVNISQQSGWTIISERTSNTLWSFTPANHPAYPAAIKRIIITKDGNLAIQMSALCQANKAACDKLIEEFKELNQQMSDAIRRDAQNTQHEPASEIEVQRLGDNEFRLLLKSFRSSTVQAGQTELLSKAKELCAGKNIDFGKYAFETSEAINPSTTEKRSLILKQEIHCGNSVSASEPPPAAGKPNTQWRPTATQEQRVEQQTRTYFSAKDGGKYPEAYALLSPSQKQGMTLEHWVSLTEKFNAQAGTVLSRKIKKISWYQNPANVEPGVYAAVDFVSQFANINIHCGFIAWHEQVDGAFLLVREEENFIDKAMQQKLKPAELEKVRAQFGC